VEIKGPNLNSLPTNQPQISSDTNQLQKGQLLKAIVAAINNNKVLLELIEPKLPLKFEAQGSQQFKLGQIVSLQIAKLGPPLSLNVLENTNIQSKSQLNIQDNIISAALRMVIPKQTSMNQLLSNLHYLNNPIHKLNNTYPKEILDLSRAVFRALPTLNDITTTGVKSALNSSGLFLENQLLTTLINNSDFTINNTRTALLRLAESIRTQITNYSTANRQSDQFTEKTVNLPLSPETNQSLKKDFINQNSILSNTKNQNFNINNLARIPANLEFIQQTNSALNELLRNIDSSLAKIQFNQLQHFVPDDQNKSNWLFDLPIKHEDGSDIFHFMFTKEESSSNNNKDDEWSVTLTFNLEKLGNVNIQIYLRNEKIGATIWAKENGTVDLFKKHLSTLQQQLEKSGINISTILCNKGEITQSECKKSHNLLNEKV